MYDIGDVWHGAIEVRDLNDALSDSTVVLNITLPDQTVAGPFIPAHDSTGKYHYDYTTVQAGRHVAKWTGTSVAFGHTDVFNVEAADISIVSLGDVKRQLSEPPASTADDDELRSYLLSASENIDNTCGPCAVRTVTSRVTAGGYALWLPKPPVVEIVSITPVYTWSPALTPADVTLNPDSGKVTRRNRVCPFYGDYDFVYKAGRPVIPSSLRTGGLMVVQHLWDTRRGPVGVSAGGDEMVTLPGWAYAIPARAAELISGYQRAMLIA